MGRRWSAHAFGLTVEGDFAAPGLDTRSDDPTGRRVSVSVAPEAPWGGGGETLCERTTPDGTLVVRFERSSAGDHRILAPGYGTFLVRADGRKIVAAPASNSPWHWQRYLVGQALPLAAVLQGLEVLHASGVVVDGEATAFSGASLAGKTTLAMALVGQGADLLCDDVLAVEPRDGRVIAHPGPPLVNLRHASAAALTLPGTTATEVGRDDEASRIYVPAARGAVPLSALYILHRGGPQRRPWIERPGSREATLLLSSSFNFIVTDRARLSRQLDVCALLAKTAEMRVVRVPDAASPLDVAELILERIRTAGSCAA